MKHLKALLCGIAAAVLFLPGAQAASTEESFQGALQRSAVTDPLQYSFADIYGLAVSGSVVSGLPLAADGPIRVVATRSQAAAQHAAAAPAQFSIGAVPEPGIWPLLLSGLLLAAWVARRRLGHAF